MSPPKMDWKCLLSHIVRSPQYDHTECYDEGYIQVAVLDMDVWFICSALFILLSLSQTLPSELTLHCETYFLWLIFCFLKHRKKLCVIFVCVLNSETFPGNVFSTTIKMFHFLLSLLVSVASPPPPTPLLLLQFAATVSPYLNHRPPKIDVTFVSGFCHSNVMVKKETCWLCVFVMVSIWLCFPMVLWCGFLWPVVVPPSALYVGHLYISGP